jgi:type IV secretion system protein VirB2
LTGTFAKTIATIAVVVLGLMAMFGKLAWDHALKVIFGIALVFGAAGIVTAVILLIYVDSNTYLH